MRQASTVICARTRHVNHVIETLNSQYLKRIGLVETRPTEVRMATALSQVRGLVSSGLVAGREWPGGRWVQRGFRWSRGSRGSGCGRGRLFRCLLGSGFLSSWLLRRRLLNRCSLLRCGFLRRCSLLRCRFLRRRGLLCRRLLGRSGLLCSCHNDLLDQVTKNAAPRLAAR